MASTTRLAALLAVLLGSLPTAAFAGELPPDRTSLGGSGGRSENVLEPLDLPAAPDSDADAGEIGWTTPNPRAEARSRQMEMVYAAFGLSGAMAGMTGSLLLISVSQAEEGARTGFRTASLVTASLSIAALVTGTVLWLTAPDAPVQAMVIPEPTGLRLALRF